jgi:O-antigen/teichoic acid export membrane protein
MMMEYRSHANVKELFSRIFSYYFLCGALIVVVAALFLDELVPILIRSEVTPVLCATVLLAMLGSLFYGATNILAAGLFYERRVFQIPLVYYSAAAFKLALGVILIIAFGIFGAAMAAVATSALIPVGVYALARRYFQFEIEWWRLRMIVLSAALPIAYGLLAREQHELPFFVRAVWLVATCVSLFYFCMRADERNLVRTVLLRD